MRHLTRMSLGVGREKLTRCWGMGTRLSSHIDTAPHSLLSTNSLTLPSFQYIVDMIHNIGPVLSLYHWCCCCICLAYLGDRAQTDFIIPVILPKLVNSSIVIIIVVGIFKVKKTLIKWPQQRPWPKVAQGGHDNYIHSHCCEPYWQNFGNVNVP